MCARNKKEEGEANRRWGEEAERIAVEHLVEEGYVIRETNWRMNNHVEIDIIAQLGDTIIFVEVKARKGDFMYPDEAVDLAKQKKMIRGGNAYLLRQEKHYKYRMDIITITGTKDNYQLRHMPDAFLPPLS